MQMFYLEDKDIWLPGDLGIQKVLNTFLKIMIWMKYKIYINHIEHISVCIYGQV